jgi:glycosyltransferase involved in cell wall biosynthesis
MFFHGPYRREQVLGSFGIDGDWQHVVVYAGKFMKRKGIDTLLEAAKLYEGEGILTVLCGDGETYDEMEGRALRLGLESVRFLGHRNQDELRRLFNIADVTVLPARGETFGLVAIEAAACGSPIIGANQSGLERIVTPDIGTFVAPDDHFSLASTIRRITEGKLVYDHDRVAFLTHSRFSQDQFTRALVERAYAPYVE